MMSESLLARVGTDQPSKISLLADFLIDDDACYSLPITSIYWKNRKIKKICFGIEKISILNQLLTSNECSVGIEDLDENLENILNSEFNIPEHHNYNYELQVVLEDTSDER